LGAGAGAPGLSTAPVRPRGSWTNVWASLRDYKRCRSTAANYGMSATPETFRLIQSPLGAASSPRLPRPSCHPVAGRDFRELRWGGSFASSRRFPSHRFRPRGILSYRCGPDALPVVTNAVASRRQAEVCLRPLQSYGDSRASRPPSVPAPGPHISGTAPARAGSRSRRLVRITPRPFQYRVRQALDRARTPCFVDASSFSLAAPEHRYEPLYVVNAAVAQRRTEVCRNP